MSATQIYPCNTPFSPLPELQLDAGNTSRLNARQLRRHLRQLRKHRRHCQCTPQGTSMELAHEHSSLFWGGGFIPTHR
ncbi:hypothetical protein [Glutamicibacter nicotianae]|uniref:hypothetical protein n=1 Tax=Glutamicibacter nicotianae TaxID=37929 RepID=UPI00167FA928|nr:hypothetical protein [Glutamicibacter nicotianae]MDV2975744.1 hypothetical protein [Actinomycetes bacterium ARC8]